MPDTLRLLKFDPAVALLIMINSQLNLYLYREFVDIGTPVAVNDSGMAEVVVSTRPSRDDGIRRTYTGQLTYRFQRLDVSAYLAETVLEFTPPITVAGLLDNLSKATGIVFSEDDFENAVISDGTFDLVAKPESLRWVGSTTVTLNPPDKVLTLAEAFPNNLLDGLWLPDFPAIVLDGLDLPPATP